MKLRIQVLHLPFEISKGSFFVVRYVMKLFSLLLAFLLLLTAVGCASGMDTLDRICEEQGYTIASQEPKPLTLTVDTSLLPADLTGKLTFEPGTIVCAEADSAVIWLDYIYKVSDTQISVGFDFTYTLPESGTVLVPYEIKLYENDERGYSHAWYVANTDDGALLTHSNGPGEKFSVYVKLDAFTASDSFTIELENFNALTYRKD